MLFQNHISKGLNSGLRLDPETSRLFLRTEATRVKGGTVDIRGLFRDQVDPGTQCELLDGELCVMMTHELMCQFSRTIVQLGIGFEYGN
uniref:Uncharacterized protein n=1 Tax=Cannabis sativa TaxID=3483 RepID=A0A803NSE3_CANSA